MPKAMKTVAVVCIKGGTGKTTIACELTYGLRELGFATSRYSLDRQYGAASDRVEDPDCAVVDTAGGEPTAEVARIVDMAALVVVPVRPTARDVEPFLATLDFIRGRDPTKPITVVINGWNHFSACQHFCDWLDAAGFVPPTEVLRVPQSEAIVHAAEAGRSVVGYDRYGRASVAVNSLVRHVAYKLAIVAASTP